jgi:hypothetical protein
LPRDGVYSLRYRIGEKRKWENLTCELFAVQKKSRLREAQIENDELKPSPVTPKRAAAITLKLQEEKFLELKKLTKKSDRTKLDKHTVSSYLRVFRSSSLSWVRPTPRTLTEWICADTSLSPPQTFLRKRTR